MILQLRILNMRSHWIKITQIPSGDWEMDGNNTAKTEAVRKRDVSPFFI